MITSKGETPSVTGASTHPSTSAVELVRREVRGAALSAIPSVIDALAAVLREHDTLYDWAGDQPQPRALRGRAPVFVAALPDTNTLVVVRHAWHGGLLAPITRDRFRGTQRAHAEFRMSHRLRQMGIPTTEVLGFASYLTTLGFHQVDVVSRFVADALDLGMIAAGLVPEIARDEALHATRVLLARLAAAGVVHPDLNVKNVLLKREADATVTAMIIDVDVVHQDAARDPADVMNANVSRLLRSMRKWRNHFGCELSEELLEQFARDAVASTPAGRRT